MAWASSAAAGDTPDGQTFVKKVVCEMGGKNAIIIDESADLDEAVLGVRQSAFGYCGQKCSACSRAIVLDAVYDRFLGRLVESTRSLVIGDPADARHRHRPGNRREALRRKSAGTSRSARAKAASNWPARCPQGLAEQVGKPYVGPHIFSGIERQHRLANEEVFGPVLSVMRVGSFDEAMDVANATAYKLTGGVFSRKPSHLEAGSARVPRGQSVSQPRHHRRPGRPSAVRRFRPFRRRHQGRRRRLPVALRRAPLLRREHHASRLRAGVGVSLSGPLSRREIYSGPLSRRERARVRAVSLVPRPSHKHGLNLSYPLFL